MGFFSASTTCNWVPLEQNGYCSDERVVVKNDDGSEIQTEAECNAKCMGSLLFEFDS